MAEKSVSPRTPASPRSSISQARSPESREGENVLVLVVARYSDSSFVEDQDQWVAGRPSIAASRSTPRIHPGWPTSTRGALPESPGMASLVDETGTSDARNRGYTGRAGVLLRSGGGRPSARHRSDGLPSSGARPEVRVWALIPALIRTRMQTRSPHTETCPRARDAHTP